jgi:hypothetical protein
MPRVTTIQTNFTGGEFSPRVLGRVDIAKYPNGCETLENVLPLIHGGAVNRYGSIYVAPAKFAAKKARLIPFVSSVSAAYVLEFGDLYMRVFTNNGQVAGPYEVVTPYTEAMLPDLDYAQSADTMFIFHPANVIYRNRRFADNAWDLSGAPFKVVPVDEIGDYPGTTLTLSAATVGVGRTVVASAASFLVSDVGRAISYQGGTLTITAFTDITHVTGDISTPFPSTAVPATWNLSISPLTACTPGVDKPVGISTTLTLATNGWRATDVGKFVSINGGRLQITAFTSALIVQATITQVLTGVTAAPADAWALLAPMWSSINGYPRTGTIYQQRLWAAGSNGFPQTFWGSAVGLYLDFTMTTNDGDGMAYTLGSDQANPIRHMTQGKILSALTYGGEFTIKGGIEKAITPTNIQVDGQTNYGASALRPVRVGNAVIFGQRNGKKLRALKYSSADDLYDSADITALSEHITGAGLADICYAAEPDPIIWAVRSDGLMASLTISEEQNVMAWARHVTDGVYESVASIPTPTGDQTWVLVRRTIGGATVRYVERLDPSVIMDAAVAGTSGPGSVVWSGLAHLEGKSVACIADGSDMGNFTVVGGQITLPRAAFAVSIGLAFTSTIKPLTVEVPTGTGTAQGQAMSTSEVVVRVLGTEAIKINGKLVSFRKFGSALLDDPPPIFTGIKSKSTIGWYKGRSDLVLTQDRPVPFHILDIVRTFTVNSGGSQ